MNVTIKPNDYPRIKAKVDLTAVYILIYINFQKYLSQCRDIMTRDVIFAHVLTSGQMQFSGNYISLHIFQIT